MMKLKHSLLLIPLVFSILLSCKKDKDPEPVTPATTPVVYDNYSNLKVGNYWIYQLFDVDSTGASTPTSSFDSCYVEKDTIVNGKTYHQYVISSPSSSPSLSGGLFRDSASYMVDYAGRVNFSSTNFTTIFNKYSYVDMVTTDTIYKRWDQMNVDTSLTVVPAGSFTTLNFRTNYIMYPPYSFAGYRRYRNARYCKNIGLISQTLSFYVSSPLYKERRLVRYHLN